MIYHQKLVYIWYRIMKRLLLWIIWFAQANYSESFQSNILFKCWIIFQWSLLSYSSQLFISDTIFDTLRLYWIIPFLGECCGLMVTILDCRSGGRWFKSQLRKFCKFRDCFTSLQIFPDFSILQNKTPSLTVSRQREGGSQGKKLIQ